MKKRNLFIGSLFTLFLVGISFSCRKEQRFETSENVEKGIAYYSKAFMTDPTFAKFVRTFVSNSFKVNRIISANQRSGVYRTATEIIDTSGAYTNVAEIVTAGVMMRGEHPEFFELPLEEQQEVVKNVFDQLANDEFRRLNPTNELVIFGDEKIRHLNEHGPLLRITAIDISWGEFAMCTAGALGAALGEYGGIIGQVWALFTQGSQYLTWGGIFQIANRVVRNAVPWYKVASIAFGYATCLWAAA